MKDDFSLKSQVNSGLLDLVEQECHKILLHQRQRFDEWWYSSALFTIVFPILRLAGLVLCVAGIALCLYFLFYQNVCPKNFSPGLYLLLFSLGCIFFYFLPDLNTRVIKVMRNVSANGSRSMAHRLVSKARKLAPFIADYNFRGDLVTYYRARDDDWQQVWSRRMSGYAFLDKHVTLFFRKPTSLQPIMLIFYDNSDMMVSVLKGTGMEYDVIMDSEEIKE